MKKVQDKTEERVDSEKFKVKVQLVERQNEDLITQVKDLADQVNKLKVINSVMKQEKVLMESNVKKYKDQISELKYQVSVGK